MALAQYILNGPATIILADQRDPAVSWANHLARTGGQRGGVDLVAIVDTPIYAPTDGVMVRRPDDGTAGHSCRFKHDHNPGWADVFSHLSAYAGYDRKHFRQGDLIGWTGDTGGVDQHLHRHLLDPQGIRRNPFDYFPRVTPAGVTLTALPDPDEDTMGFYITVSNQAPKFWVSQSTGQKRSIGRTEWAGLRAVEAAGGPPLVVVTVTAGTLAAFPGR